METKDLATTIVNKLVRHGYIAYFAGGWVRDLILKHPSDDIDIATNAPTEAILDLFPHTILVGLSFGVVIVVLDGYQFEVSTFRKDIDYRNGRKPERIEKATPQEDALRRDFTINGMFYDPIENLIHDFVHGMEDIKLKVVRTIGDPQERFTEDRLRMIRAFRFAARFDFIIDSDTQIAIQENADTLFPSVAIERVWQEFCKMSAYRNFENALIEMHRLGLLPVIFPALEDTHLNDLKKRVHPLSLYPHNYPTILFLLELFPDMPWDGLADLCRYLKVSIKEQSLLEFFYRSRQKFFREKHAASLVDWAHFYAHPKSSLFLQVEETHLRKEEIDAFRLEHQERQKELAFFVDRLKSKQPIVTSRHLKNEGIEPGKHMGDLLKEAEKFAINQNIQDPSLIIAHLKRSPLWLKHAHHQ
ncbi:MAG: CCA tRNA nucleotidyltransferase [Parachlamydiaceae bacterium]